MSLVLGLPALRPNAGDVETWAERPVMLPHGWEAIEVHRLWARGRPMTMTAKSGEPTRLEPLIE